MLRDKKALLACARDAAEYINNTGGGDFSGFILDIIRYVDKQNQQQLDGKNKLQKFWQILYNVKSTNIEMIGGGKSVKKSYMSFIDDFLGIEKIQDRYEIKNEKLVNLDFNEIYYVFAWVRRLAKKGTKNEKDENVEQMRYKGAEQRKYEERGKYNRSKSNMRYDNNINLNSNLKSNGNKKHDKNYEPLNTQLMDQLKKYKDINKI